VESRAAGFLLGFDPEDGGKMFLRNVGWLSMDYTAIYPRGWEMYMIAVPATV
jgi:hypothetical protein